MQVADRHTDWERTTLIPSVRPTNSAAGQGAGGVGGSGRGVSSGPAPPQRSLVKLQTIHLAVDSVFKFSLFHSLAAPARP